MAPQKRRGSFESDEEAQSDDGQPGPSSAHSSGRKRRRVSDESRSRSVTPGQEDDDVDVSIAPTPPSEFDTDDEEDLLEAASQAVKQRRQRESHGDNKPADHGILEKVQLVNFMCHKNYEYKLGPLINFICGRNGSGKSAILTAIVLCLGGKAAATNRGSSLKDFIREGTDHASIICHIKNQGDAAYMRDVYGNTIQVERYFSRNGPSGFRIKSEKGRVISTKRADLDEITDHFTLQIENPLNVLTQDQARQFITTSSAGEKYKFFVKGVLLEQLDQDYRLIQEQLDNINPKIEATRPDISILEQNWQVADTRLQSSRKHDTWRKRVDELRKWCVWIQVQEQEEVLADREKTVADQKLTIEEVAAQIPPLREKFEASDRLDQEAKETLEKVEKELKEAEEQKAEANEPHQTIKSDVSKAITEFRAIRGELQQARKTIENKKAEIEAEEQRLSELDGGGAARRHRELAEAREAANEAKKNQDEHAAVKADLQREVQILKDEEKTAEFARRQKVTDVQQQEDRLRTIRTQEQTQDNVYHPNMPQILRDIQRENRFRDRPIGPIGKYIKLLAPEWSSILEKSFGGTLNGFVVTSKHDEAILSPIIKRYGPPNIPTFMGQPGALNTSDKEPDAQFTTVMRSLEIDDEYVRKVMIIMHNIENTGLISDQAEASQVLFQDRARNMARCYCFHPKSKARGIFLSFRGGRPAQDPIDQWQGKTRMKTNLEAQVRAQENVVHDAKAELQELEQHHRAVRDRRVKAEQAVERHRRDAASLKIAVQQADDKVEGLVDIINEDNTRAGSLEVLRQALEAAHLDKETKEGLYSDSQNALDDKKKELKEGTRKLNEMDNRISELKEIAKELKKQAQKTDKDRTFDLQECQKVEEEKQEAERDLETMERMRNEQKVLIADWIEKASEVCARINIPEGETKSTLNSKHENLKRKLSEAERRIGDPREVEAKAAEALEAYSKAKKDLQGLEDLSAQLTESLENRRNRWRQFRGRISASARSGFTFLLSERGFRGEILMSHGQRALDLAVEPDITERDATGRSARTLSGGEKSFSQICLLLAIWEAMGSPIRCLDEFDVFMDAVNRSTSVNLLIEAARASPGKQYILISPGTKSDIKKAPDVHTIEIAPPERGQGQLSFAAAS